MHGPAGLSLFKHRQRGPLRPAIGCQDRFVVAADREAEWTWPRHVLSAGGRNDTAARKDAGRTGPRDCRPRPGGSGIVGC